MPENTFRQEMAAIHQGSGPAELCQDAKKDVDAVGIEPTTFHKLHVNDAKRKSYP